MSKVYRETLTTQPKTKRSAKMRTLCQRPGKTDKNGNIVYFTEQSHKSQCDVNKIIAKYDKHGLLQHVSRFEAQFGDVSGIDFKEAQDLVAKAKSSFNDLPSEIRNRFKNSPQELLAFMDDPNNRDEAIKLGIIDPRWTIDSDGLGEHVPLGDNKNIPESP